MLFSFIKITLFFFKFANFFEIFYLKTYFDIKGIRNKYNAINERHYYFIPLKKKTRIYFGHGIEMGHSKKRAPCAKVVS